MQLYGNPDVVLWIGALEEENMQKKFWLLPGHYPLNLWIFA